MNEVRYTEIRSLEEQDSHIPRGSSLFQVPMETTRFQNLEIVHVLRQNISIPWSVHGINQQSLPAGTMVRRFQAVLDPMMARWYLEGEACSLQTS